MAKAGRQDVARQDKAVCSKKRPLVKLTGTGLVVNTAGRCSGWHKPCSKNSRQMKWPAQALQQNSQQMIRPAQVADEVAGTGLVAKASRRSGRHRPCSKNSGQMKWPAQAS